MQPTGRLIFHAPVDGIEGKRSSIDLPLSQSEIRRLRRRPAAIGRIMGDVIEQWADEVHINLSKGKPTLEVEIGGKTIRAYSITMTYQNIEDEAGLEKYALEETPKSKVPGTKVSAAVFLHRNP